MTEDLRFGGDKGDDHYLWTSGQFPVGLEVDDAGRFYLCDTQTVRLLVFDQEGRFLRQMARRGQGPGEYEHLSGFRIFNNGTAVGFQIVSTTSRYNYYNADMSFGSMHQRQDPWNLAHLIFSMDGDYAYGFLYKPKGPQTTMSARHVLLNGQLEVLKTLDEVELPKVNESRFYDPSYWVDQIAGQFHRRFRGRSTIAFCRDGSMLIANTAAYHITRYQDHQSPIWSMEKRYKPIPISDEEIEAFAEELRQLFHRAFPELKRVITDNVIRKGVEAADAPPAKNPIYDIIPFDDSTFLVVHDYNTKTREARADIFAANGHYMGHGSLPTNLVWDFNSFRFFFKGKYAYALVTSPEGDIQVVRYRYQLESRQPQQALHLKSGNLR